MKKLTIILFLLLIVACADAEQPIEPTTAPTAQPTNTPTLEPPPEPTAEPEVTFPWWNDVVWYEIFVRSFYDSDGDGVGDINGMIEKLDYLNDGDPTTTTDLGITGIWLMPIAVSPSYHGYDVVDYFNIDPEYGTNDDFKRFMEEAHARGIHVVVDLVMNHTGIDHPWFVESKDPDSDKRDWYIWADENPNYRGPDGRVAWHASGGDYYYGVFWSGMPDLNFENPDVTQAMYDAAEFWLTDMNVDGFRLDAIKHMIEEGRGQENTPSTHRWLADFYTFYKGVSPEAFTVGEAWTGTQQVLKYTGDEVDIAFQFDLALDTLNASDAGLAPLIADTMGEVYDVFPANQYATFITNHDQNRVMSQLDGEFDKAKLAASILLTNPGVPFIYYGEEIGMTGTKPDEDIRRPMQWSGEQGVGFTTGTPWRAPADDFSVVNVALQQGDDNSLLELYRGLIHLRNEHDALRIGEWALVEANSPRLYTFVRQTANETILVVINLSRQNVTAEKYSLALDASSAVEGATVETLWGDMPTAQPSVNADGGFVDYIPYPDIPARSTHILRFVNP